MWLEVAFPSSSSWLGIPHVQDPEIIVNCVRKINHRIISQLRLIMMQVHCNIRGKTMIQKWCNVSWICGHISIIQKTNLPLMQSCKEGLFQLVIPEKAPYTACSWSLQLEVIWQFLSQKITYIKMIYTKLFQNIFFPKEITYQCSNAEYC